MADEQEPTQAGAVRRRLESDPHELAGVVRLATGRQDAIVDGWSIDQLGGGAGNPTSDGLFRISGDAPGHVPAAWSVVLKRLRSPSQGFDRMDQPGDLMYWRREVDVYRSNLLDGLPAGIVAPRCLGIREHSDATAWLWLEDVGPMDPGRWTEAECLLVASHLARFHAAYLTDRDVPDAPWLTACVARRWHALTMPMFRDVLDRAEAGQAEYSALDPARSAPRVAAVVALLREPEAFLTLLESRPQTLCHHDTNADNLLLRATPGMPSVLRVIDWQLVGRGPIGEDIGQFLASILAAQDPSERAVWEDAILVGYWRELVAAGVDISLQDTWLGYCAAAAVRQACFAFLLLALELADVDRRDTGAVVDTFATRLSDGHLPGLVERAWTLLRK